ncbi:MAG: AI-2E family transporter [Herpetosiphonaceae bacterium]|nr:AI-2E family transporter [Herpetosiphonaceae bacterium]
MPKNITIQITGKSIAWLLLAAALIWLAVSFDKILFILFLAILVAVAINPSVNWLQERKLPRALAILIMYILILTVFGFALGLLVPVVAAEFSSLGTNLPNLIQQATTLPQRLIGPYFPSFTSNGSLSSLAQQIGGELGNVAKGTGGILLSLGKTLTTILVSTFLILVVGFFLTADAKFAPRLIARFFPPRLRPTASGLAKEIGTRLGHWVRAQLLVGLFFGTTFGIGLKLLGVKYALSLGAAGAVLELVPYLGGVIVTAIAVVVAFGGPAWLPLAVVVLELIVANLESHVVYPKLVGDIVGLHPLTIVIALFMGAEVKGIMGALVAVPLAVVAQVLFDHFYRFEDTAQAIAEETVGETVEGRIPSNPQATKVYPST